MPEEEERGVGGLKAPIAPTPHETITPLLPELRKGQCRSGGQSPPPPSEASAVGGVACQEPSPPPRAAQSHRSPRKHKDEQARLAARPSERPHGPKPVKWSVVPTSMVMTHNAAWRPVETHRDASAVLATPAAGISAGISSGIASSIAAGFASGVPMTGLRDSTLSEALPALATLVKPSGSVVSHANETKISPRPRRTDQASTRAPRPADLAPPAQPAPEPVSMALGPVTRPPPPPLAPPPPQPPDTSAKQTRVSFALGFAEPWHVGT